MKVLSLFDGIACGRLALEKAHIPVEQYVASEIHHPSIQTAIQNYPDIQEIGNIHSYIPTFIPDLLIGGSPCTNLSVMGKQNGMTDGTTEIYTLEHYLSLKQKNTHFEGQSYLFWEYVRILQECKPKYFLLENVLMQTKWKNIISDVLQTDPILINSNLFSAQNRKRLYWTNIPIAPLPDGTHSPTLSSILDSQANDENVGHLITVQKALKRMDEKYGYIPQRFNAYNACEIKEKAPTLSTGSMVTSSCATLMFVPKENGNYEVINGWVNKQYRTPLPNGKYNIRKLSAIEMERLQTLPDNYTQGISRNQREKAIGNGWTADVIAHIFQGLSNKE